MTREWNASAYHKVSGPQTGWGQKVLARLRLDGHERVVDAGCGSGRLTAELLERLPSGRVLALDGSWNMLQTARANLRPSYGGRVHFVQATLPFIPMAAWADVIFSTATFHWVADHPALFANLLTALKPGGRLHAQCGGGPNLARAHALAEEVMVLASFAEFFAGWPGAWQFASADITRTRLEGAGFADVSAWLEEAPTTLASEADYREFVTTVIYRHHLERLPARLRTRFLNEVTARAAAEPVPFTLDYWRLNIEAQKPESR